MSAQTADAPVAASMKAPAKTKKKSVPKKPADHPTYNVMASEAIKALKERSGSSRQAILTYIMKNYNVIGDQSKVNVHLKQALKNGVAKKEFKQVKGTGASGSFRLGENVTTKPKVSARPAKKVSKPKVATPKKPNAKKSPAKGAAAKKSVKSVTKKSTAKKTSTKKPAPKKPAAKKPTAKKSTKKPAVKTAAKKTAAKK